MLEKIFNLIRGSKEDPILEATSEPTDMTTNVYVDWNDGPSAADGTSWSPRFYDTTTDWKPESGHLVLRPANLMGSNPNGRRCGHEEIVNFIKSNRNRNITINVLTSGAHGMFPQSIALHYANGKLRVESSHYCKPSDIDSETMNLIQKIANAFGVKLNFSNSMTEWRQRYSRISELSKKGEWHSVAEAALLINA